MPLPIAKRISYRIFQGVMYLASYFFPWKQPVLLKGQGAVHELPALIKKKKLTRAFFITDEGIMKIGLMNALLKILELESIPYTLFGEVVPNPTVEIIEKAVLRYKECGCDHIIAMGGGSAIDAGKVLGARIARPSKSIRDMKGLLKVIWKIPPLFAIPTTAGTGSECTLAAVVSNPPTNEKYAISDPCLFPPYAVLDPLLTVGLPKFVTATTGMDTLTHGIEAYLGIFQTCSSGSNARRAIKLTFGNLKRAYDNGEDVEARENMQEAAFYGGLAFTRVYVGYVHAIAHCLGGFYGVPHGYANAVILPVVLDAYGAFVYNKLSRLADEVGLQGNSTEEKAKSFILAIRQLNSSMGIPEIIGKEYGAREEDLDEMVEHAMAEAHPLYPVPVLFNQQEIRSIFQLVLGF